MKKRLNHIASIGFIGLYLILSVLHSGVNKPLDSSIRDVSVVGNEQVFLVSDGFNGCLNALHPNSATIELVDSSQVTIRLPFYSCRTAVSVADFLITTGQASYLYHSAIFVVQPQIFDLLFPFHYYS